MSREQERKGAPVFIHDTNSLKRSEFAGSNHHSEMVNDKGKGEEFGSVLESRNRNLYGSLGFKICDLKWRMH